MVANLTVGEEAIPVNGFILRQSRKIETLNLTIHEYQHQKTGASHFHMQADNTENVFMVALRTVPMDSTGVAHVLEHTALCGSERFPVRDPFFLMIRRSLNTFMNAFTTSDYTAYPFASMNEKDYFNLLDIYLDAVFFSRLDKLDFAQEGHRLEFEQPDDADSPLVYRGVVYNEMKGDSSSPVSALYSELQKHIFPTTTYHYNSGGDPKHIPELTYEQLKDFYRSHYHPSNAVFMTYGDLPVQRLQAFMESKALHGFDKSADVISVAAEQRFTETKRVTAPYAVDESGSGKTHVVFAWLLPENTDLEMLLKCNILSDVLLDTSASPLKKALETFEFSAGASPLCGLEETNHEMSFMCGVEGSDPEHADAVEALIFSVLEEVAQQGIEPERVEAVLHQLELSQREVGGDGMPYGLQLIFSCMSAAIHRGSPIELLDIDPVIKKIRREALDPEFIKTLVRELLLDNTHRVRLTLVPDAQLQQQDAEQEAEKLASIKAGLSDAQRQNILNQAAELQARQEQQEDLSVLPKVSLKDIPETLKIPSGRVKGNQTHYAAGTNGLVYQQVIRDIPALSADLVQLLPIYSQLITEVGSAGRDYLQTQLLQHAQTGGLSAYSSIRAHRDDPDLFAAKFTIASKTLNNQAEQMMRLVQQTAQRARFDEQQRIRELVKLIRTRRLANVAGNGHSYAMMAAGSCLRPVSLINHKLSGLKGLSALQQLDDALDTPANLQKLCENLEELHQRMNDSNRQFLLVAEDHEIPAMSAQLASVWQGSAAPVANGSLAIDFKSEVQNQAYLTNTTVNYCVSVFPTVAENHPDAAALTVLATVLRNGYLHQAIREQGGAYGGGASYDGSNGLFRFYSYRDPQLNETFAAYINSVQWLLTSEIDFALIEEAILGVVSAIDAPGSPAGDARQAFHNGLFGRDADYRRALRARYLAVDQEAVKRVATQYLQGEGCKALVSSESCRNQIDNSFVIQSI